jgi:hypothetical protein
MLSRTRGPGLYVPEEANANCSGTKSDGDLCVEGTFCTGRTDEAPRVLGRGGGFCVRAQPGRAKHGESLSAGGVVVVQALERVSNLGGTVEISGLGVAHEAIDRHADPLSTTRTTPVHRIDGALHFSEPLHSFHHPNGLGGQCEQASAGAENIDLDCSSNLACAGGLPRRGFVSPGRLQPLLSARKPRLDPSHLAQRHPIQSHPIPSHPIPSPRSGSTLQRSLETRRERLLLPPALYFSSSSVSARSCPL